MKPRLYLRTAFETLFQSRFSLIDMSVIWLCTEIAQRVYESAGPMPSIAVLIGSVTALMLAARTLQALLERLLGVEIESVVVVRRK